MPAGRLARLGATPGFHHGLLRRGRWGLVAAAALAAAPAPLRAQSAECATVECARSAPADASPAARKLWEAAAAAHAVKVEFVEAVREFALVQAGAAGQDEATPRHLAAMREPLARWEAAIQAIETAARPQLRSAETLVALGAVYLDRHRTADAVRALTEAARIDPDRPDIQASLALAYVLAGKAAEAARPLRAAARLDPRNAAVAYRLAQALRDAGDAGEAGQALERFVRLRSSVPLPVTVPAADLRLPSESPFERAGLFRQTAGIAPLFASARLAAAFSRLDSGDYAAIEEMAGAAAADAAVTAEQRRGLDAWVAGDHNAALRELQRAIELRPGDERPRLAMAFVLREAGRPSEAERELRAAIAAFPQAGLPWYRLGQLLEGQARLPEAANAFAESLARGPVLGRDALYQRLARIRVNQADFAAAIAAYETRVSISPNSAEAHRSLGEIYFLQGRDAEALAEFLVAVWLDPNDARAFAALGKVHVRAGRYAEAVPALRRAVAFDAARADARYALGQALGRLGRGEEARRETAEFQRLDAEERARGQRDFRIEQDRVESVRLLAAGDVDAALEILRRLAEEEPENPRWLREQGAALVRGRRFAEAIVVLEAAQARTPTVETARLLADAHAAAGHAAEARQHQARYDDAMRQARLTQLMNLEAGP